MNSGRRILVFGLFVSIVGLTIVFELSPREPAYQGRRLNAWLKDLDAAGGTAPSAQVQQAFHELGTNCLPRLVAMLRAEDPRFKKMLVHWLAQQSLITWQVTTEDDLRERAGRAFAVLGAQAAPAVPELVQVLQDDPRFWVRESACEALGWIGPAAVAAAPAMIRALHDRHVVVRRYAARALGQLGPVTPNVVPALIDAMTNNDWYAEENALNAIGAIGPAASNAIPALLDQLKHVHPDFRTFAARALGDVGPSARAAIPALRAATADPHSGVRRAARAALKKIDPEFASGSGLE